MISALRNGPIRVVEIYSVKTATAVQTLTTATAIGDDTLQRQTTGRVVPDSFTHGSAAQRKQWFMTGYQQGTVQACNTFGAG